MEEITVTEKQLAAAFTEWHRRWQENPKKFLSEQESLADDPKNYGEWAAPYFVKILKTV